MRFWRILFLAVSTVAIMGFAFWIAFRFSGEPRKGVGMKRLSGTVAEGFSYRSGKEFHPRASCGACRIRKVKLGVFSIGGMDVLEFDDLVVNIPSIKNDINPNPGRESVRTSVEVPQDDAKCGIVQCFNLKTLVAAATGSAKRNFVGIKINRFALNRMDGEKLRPVFSADSIKNKKKVVVMQGVSVFQNGMKERHQFARLELGSRVKIVWDGGFWDITDIVSGLR